MEMDSIVEGVKNVTSSLTLEIDSIELVRIDEVGNEKTFGKIMGPIVDLSIQILINPLLYYSYKAKEKILFLGKHLKTSVSK